MLPFPGFLQIKDVRKATDEELDHAIEWFEQVGITGGVLVIVGLVIEVLIAWCHPSYDSFWETWGSVVADSLVAIGVMMEVICSRLGGTRQREVKRRSDVKISLTNEKAARADLARIELEKQLKSRTISAQQFEILKKLKGHIGKLRIAADTDSEPIWFANMIAIALQKIGIETELAERAPRIHSNVNMLCDKFAYANPNGYPTHGEPILSVLNEAGILIVGVLAGYPGDLRGIWDEDDVPMVLIGGKFIPPDDSFLSVMPAIPSINDT